MKKCRACSLSEQVTNFLKSDVFNRIPRVNTEQINLARDIGIDVIDLPMDIAWSLINYVVQVTFDHGDKRKPTQKQIEFVAKYAIDVSDAPRFVVDAIINALMTSINIESIERERLAPGINVVKTYSKLKTVYVISSIAEDGTVYFKGGNGQKAWARNLKSVEEQHQNEP
jgi:hypothetical protein